MGGAKAVSAEEAREARLHYFDRQTAARQVSGGGRLGTGAIRQAAYRLFKSMSLYVALTYCSASRPLWQRVAAGRSSAAPAAAAKSDFGASHCLEEATSEIDGLLAAVEDAPAEMLEPALELLITIYTAIIEKPNEPKVRRIRWVKCCYGACVCVCVCVCVCACVGSC